MILQALNDYYLRLLNEPDSGIPKPGFCQQGIHFCLVLDRDGNLIGTPVDLRKKTSPKRLMVPQAVKRSSGIAANFLWDNTGYVLGADNKGNPERTLKAFQAFKELQHLIGDMLNDTGMKSLLIFLDKWDPEKAEAMPLWEEMKGLNLVFKLDGDLSYIHERPAVQKAWLDYYNGLKEKERGMCLVTGEKDVPISRLHAAIKGVQGAQTSGAALISFNLPSFISYGKEQNYNAPVGETAAFNYTTVLNHLLSSDSRQKVRIGDATTIFWTEKASPVESLIAGLFDPGILDNAPDKLQNDLRIFLESVSKGEFPRSFDHPENLFYILGLSPNAARISVRFWYVSTVKDITEHIGQYFRELSMVKNFETEPSYPSPWQLLKEMAAQRNTRNISPLLSGHLMRSILTGMPYPQTILTGIISRIRADKQINYLRASLLKAILIRNKNMEVTMSLDTGSDSIGYRLGRLFATLEKAQEEAASGRNGKVKIGINATIKDRFFGAASATPGRVFPMLLRSVQNHISKLRKNPEKAGRAKYFDRMIGDIIAPMEKFPTALSLEDQGLFSIGYYHQRKGLFTKKTDKEEE